MIDGVGGYTVKVKESVKRTGSWKENKQPTLKDSRSKKGHAINQRALDIRVGDKDVRLARRSRRDREGDVRSAATFLFVEVATQSGGMCSIP